ncbi:hypothetical protein vseg_007627 [Gypsophila vaccaria]
MESPEASYVSSPQRSAPPASDYMEKATYLKFLVSNASAGSVIGKGGSTITDFQKDSGARIQLSRNQEYFPGTPDRIIMLSGKIDDVLKAMDLILNKLSSEIQSEDGDDVDQRFKVRLIVPNSCCGAIIGKGGVTIKSFIDDSGAGIKISPQDNNYIGLTDRIVTLTGSFEEQMQAIDLILSKLTEDHLYLQSMNGPLSYPGVLFAGFHRVPYPYVLPSVGPATYANYGPPNGVGGRYPNIKEDRGNSLTIGVADEHIGVVVGRGGRNIMEISQASGARIKISDRGDFMSGTSDRKVTITGPLRAIRAAETMIKQKVESVAER